MSLEWLILWDPVSLVSSLYLIRNIYSSKVIYLEKMSINQTNGKTSVSIKEIYTTSQLAQGRFTLFLKSSIITTASLS